MEASVSRAKVRARAGRARLTRAFSISTSQKTLDATNVIGAQVAGSIGAVPNSDCIVGSQVKAI
jgi:hypothetical protein